MATLSSRLSPLTVSVPAASDWVAYTPTVSNLGAGSGTATGFWRRSGDQLDVRINFVKDATPGSGATTVLFSLPTGLSIDFAKLTTDRLAGLARMTNSSNITWATANSGSSSTDLIIANGSGGIYQTGSSFGANVRAEIECRVPISGWTSHVATTTGPNALVVGGQSVGSTLSFGATSNQGFNILANNAAAIASTAAGALTLGLTSKIGSSDYAGQAIVGRTNGSEISAGYVGQSQTQNSGSVTPGSTGAYKTITSISLTAGVYIVSGSLGFQKGTMVSTSNNYIAGGISLTNNALDTTTANNFYGTTGIPAFFNFPVGAGRLLNLSATTTVYLVGRCDYDSVGSATFINQSIIQAVRIA